jgi:diguanylate cyclase (GGDEF)-like protein
MINKLKPHQKLDPADWVMVFLSWMIYLGGLIFFSEDDNYWVLMALGALPVLVTAWSLGMGLGVVSAFVSIFIHLSMHILHPKGIESLNTLLFNHLISFSLLAITAMFIGHLKDIQLKSSTELLSLSENNKKLVRLSQALEATNQLTTDLITSQNWMEKIPDLLRNIGLAAGVDHLILFQLTGNGIVNFSGRLYHHWAEIQSNYPERENPSIPEELTTWIETAEIDQPMIGTMDELTEETREYFFLQDRGSYVVFPIFTSVSLWGFIAFESFSPDKKWESPELNTFRSIAQTLGSIIYKKLIEDNLNLRAKELDSLQKASTKISSSDQLETGLQSVLSQIYELTPAYNTSIYLAQNNGLQLFLTLGKNKQQTLLFSHPGEEELAQLVATTKQDLYISNIAMFDEVAQGNSGPEQAVISFPLKAASEVIGVLNIWYDTIRTFSEEERTILRLLADQATTAIVNMQYIQAERDQRILADTLRNANLQLSDNLELTDVLESILKQVLLLVSAREAQVFLYDGKTLEFGAVIYAEEVQEDPVHLPAPDSIFYETAQTGERILVPDIQAEKNLQDTWKTGSLVSMPLIFHKQVIGIMNVSFAKPGKPDEGLLEVLDLLSNQASIAINNARTFEAEREQRRLAQALQNTGRAIQSSLDLEVVLDQILIQISTVIPYHTANLILVENGEMRIVRQQGFQEDKDETDDQSNHFFNISRFITLVRMRESKKPLIIPDVTGNPDWIITDSTKDVMSWAGAPILEGDNVIGFLSLNNHTSNFYNQDHSEILSAFASQASIALTHARLHHRIHELAITDPLTGILNRLGLERWGKYEIDRAKRFNSPLSAIFFDLDKFKVVNDTYGHDVGDEVLKQMVNCCLKVIRSIDIFSRVGGEEFLIILPETSLPIAIQVAERIRLKAEEFSFQSNSHNIKMTLSLGVVELNEEIDTLSELMNAADQYMYKSKQSGRNRTSHSQSNS